MTVQVNIQGVYSDLQLFGLKCQSLIIMSSYYEANNYSKTHIPIEVDGNCETVKPGSEAQQ